MRKPCGPSAVWTLPIRSGKPLKTTWKQWRHVFWICEAKERRFALPFHPFRPFQTCHLFVKDLDQICIDVATRVMREIQRSSNLTLYFLIFFFLIQDRLSGAPACPTECASISLGQVRSLTGRASGWFVQEKKTRSFPLVTRGYSMAINTGCFP